jgi:hypothetical protein
VQATGSTSIETSGVGHQARTLRLERLPDRPIAVLGVAMKLRVGDALVEQPAVQFLVALDNSQVRIKESVFISHIEVRQYLPLGRSSLRPPLPPPSGASRAGTLPAREA